MSVVLHTSICTSGKGGTGVGRREKGTEELRGDFAPTKPLTKMASPGFLCAISIPSSATVELSNFQDECREAHKSRREFLQGGNIQVLSHEHYIGQQGRGDMQTCMDVYELSDIEPMLSGKVLLEEGGDGPLVTHTYTYKLLRQVNFLHMRIELC